MKARETVTVQAVLPPTLAPVLDLAMNLRWSWHVPTREFFRDLDPESWERYGHNPVAVVRHLTAGRIEQIGQSRDLTSRMNDLAQDLREYLSAPSWHDSVDDAPAGIAYFSPEFGLDAVLPQYSGGLGILAGDHLKSASDLGVPIVGVGLWYSAGYFQQSLSHEGWQTESYPHYDPSHLPLTPVTHDDGSRAVVSLDLPGGRTLRAQIWRIDVGRVPLLVLDSRVEGNDKELFALTERLYGGGSEQRLQQELLLGVGGMRALDLAHSEIGLVQPEVFHMNEGHAGFLGVERIRRAMEHGLSFGEALEAVRAATVFTTHTPVPAGIDRFDVALVQRYFSVASWNVPVEQVLALGEEPGAPGVFNMACMGLRLGGRANGVSQLHGEVSRDMFSDLWPGFDNREVPITSITNGVHSDTWTHPRMAALSDRSDASPAEWWAARNQQRSELVDDVRSRVRSAWTQRGASPAELAWTDAVADPDVLTIGFARRVPTYKRLTLMLRDPERLAGLLLHPERPIQLVIAGKSHPHDEQGKRLIQELVRFADRPELRHRIAFLPNYDMAMSRVLLAGCDVWLNNPLRPLEACGTSGMKAALNGGLNLSILDGWWDEWHDAMNGWAIPSADGIDDTDRRDDFEAKALYDLIEHEVAPAFYDRDQDGIPQAWVERMVHTVTTLGPKVQATRMVQDYTTTLYIPAATAARQLGADGAARARELAAWKAQVRSSWPNVKIEHVESHGMGATATVGQQASVQAYVALGGLDVADVEVQVLTGPVTSDGMIDVAHTVPMQVAESYEATRHRLTATVDLDTPGHWGYGVRIVPRHPLLTSAAEMGLSVS